VRNFHAGPGRFHQNVECRRQRFTGDAASEIIGLHFSFF